jgi:hypothetical protein
MALSRPARRPAAADYPTVATILIKPVDTRLCGGDGATLTGVDASDPVTITGDIAAGGTVVKDVSWDLDGNCINNEDKFNLDADAEEIRDVLSTARKLAALELRMNKIELAHSRTVEALAARLTKLGG